MFHYAPFDLVELLCKHLFAIRLAHEHMSGFVQAVGTGGSDLVCQNQWSWSVFVVLWPTYSAATVFKD